nr:retrovirus-related Pol polyprotein from transposon TNT 1-94 [Tanacetum cinerariifolium]
MRSLPPEWNTHVVAWMNKTDIETMSIDDLYNNFKIVEQDVKKFVGTSTGAQNMAFMTTSSTSSTNDVNTANPAYKASTISPNVNTASPQVSTANFSNNVVYAFMVENPNGSNLLQQDLEKIHEDDLEAMDLIMRAKRYFQKTRKKIFINANDTVRYDKSNVDCFNCHKMGHFAREYRAQRNQDARFRNEDNTRKQGNNEDTSSKVMIAIDGVGFDWSDIAEELVQTNMALMAFLDSEVNNDKSCTKTCLKNYETLKKQCDDLIVKLNQTEFTAATNKRGLAIVEEQLLTYKKNEVLFSEEVAVLKREVACKDHEINVLKSQFEKVKQEKEGIVYKIKKFDNASKSLDKLIGSQITDNSIKGLGLDEFKEPKFKGYGPRYSKLESNINYDQKSDDSKENSDDTFVKEQVSEDTTTFVESPLNGKPQKDDKGFIDSVYLRHMTGNVAYLSDFKEFNGGYVTFGGGAHGGRISSKATKDETSEILKNFIKEIENLVDKKVKIIRCNNGIEFKNKVMDDFCREKGFKPAVSFMRSFGCHVTILNTVDNLDKFDGKVMKVQFQMNLHVYKEILMQDVEDGPHNKDDDKDKSKDDSSPKEVNDVGQHFNTASLEVNTGCFELNNVDPSLNTTSSSDPHSPTDMFKLGASDTLEATHVEFFSDKNAPEVDLGNILNSYGVPTTSHTRIHKDRPIKNVIGKIEPIGIGKALSNSSWVEAMQEELLQLKLQQVLILMDLPYEKKAIGTKWVFKNKKDERGIVIRNKASQDKYVHEILKKFNYLDVKSASTPVDLEKPLVKDGDANDVDIVMENPNHLNDLNVPEGDQAPAAPDGFAPQWIYSEVNEEVMDDDDWEDDVEWLMAPMTPPRATMTVSSTYEAGVIEDLGTRLGNLEYKHGVLMRKIEEVSDAEVADSIAIRGIHPRVATIGEQVQEMESQAVQVLQTRVTEMESHMGVLISHMLWMEERLTVLEKRLPGPPPGPQ